MNLDEARRDLTKKVVQSAREHEGWPGEADERVNNANRRVVAAMAEAHGEAWLGKINLYGNERHGGHPVMWKWDGGTVYNFDAAFVVPAFDEELVRLVKERDDAEYTGTKDDAVRVEAIMQRITDIGGVHLFWT
jgi:hypothetical protein